MSLRQRKAANTRIGLIEALLARVDDRPLAAISVTELCEEVGISPATFFNYFPTKEALLVYFVQLWSVQMAAAVASHPEDDPLGAIEVLFQATAAQHLQHSGVMAEIVALQARSDLKPCPPPTDADLRRAFPGEPELLEAPRDAGLEALIPPLLRRAIALGQLPAHTPVQMVFAAIVAIFFGTTVVGRQLPEGQRATTIPALYQQQLQWLWAALGRSETRQNGEAL